MRYLWIVLLLLIPVTACATDEYVGKGCTTAFAIDEDCDGYGIGEGLSGPDADDNDATINTVASVEAKYGSITSGPNVIANLKSFFCTQKGHCNIDDIIFVSSTADNSTGAKNDIAHPYRYMGYAPGTDYSTTVKAVSGFGAGDLVLYRGGTYTDNISANKKDQIDVSYSMPVGTSTAPVIFAGFPGEKPILAGPMEGFNGQNTVLRDLWYIFDGFQIGSLSANTAGNGVQLTGAREVTWRNLEIYRKMAAGHRIMAYVDWPNATTQVPLKNILLEKSIVAYTDGTLGVATHNIYWGTAIPKGFNNPSPGCRVRSIISHSNKVRYDGMQFNGHFTDWEVSGSQFHSSSSWGFATLNGPSDGKFVNNLIYNNNSNGIKIGKYTGFVGSSGQYAPNGASNVTGNLWANNTVWLNDTQNDNGGIEGPLSWNALYFYTETTTFTAPRSYVDTTTGESITQGDTVYPDLTRSHSGNIFRNNIFISSGNSPNYASPIRSDQRSHLEQNTFDHNLFWNSSGSTAIANLKNNTETWTLAQFDADGTITASDNITANPLFLDVVNTYVNTEGLFNFQLTETSPAKSAGVAIDGITTDITGANYGAPPSIGAYEYGSYTPPTDIIKPTTTANKTAGRYTSTPRPTLTCADDIGGSGCDSTVYCLDFTNSCNPATTYTGVIENLLMNTAGPQYLRFKSTDTATNAETVQSLKFEKKRRR